MAASKIYESCERFRYSFRRGVKPEGKNPHNRPLYKIAVIMIQVSGLIDERARELNLSGALNLYGGRCRPVRSLSVKSAATSHATRP